MQIGELVGRGRTSDVYAYGTGSVIKVPHPNVPADWPQLEAQLTEAVRAQGVPAPEVRDVVEIDARSAIVFERIEGLSLWQEMLADPTNAERRVRDFAAIHRSVLHVGLPAGVPDFVGRLVHKISAASPLSTEHRDEAAALAAALPRGAALLHGDLHPGNILMGEQGPVVIDWFDAAIGHPVADIMRSLILIQPSRSSELRHLPGATAGLLEPAHRGYVDEFANELRAERAQLGDWQAVLAAGRLAEQAEVDESGLIALWAARGTSLDDLEPLVS